MSSSADGSRPVPKCYALHVYRALIDRSAADVLGPKGLALLLAVGAELDRLGYHERARIPNSKLCRWTGIAKVHTLNQVRSACVAAGWLDYRNRGHAAGEYWLLIPVDVRPRMTVERPPSNAEIGHSNDDADEATVPPSNAEIGHSEVLRPNAENGSLECRNRTPQMSENGNVSPSPILSEGAAAPAPPQQRAPSASPPPPLNARASAAAAASAAPADDGGAAARFGSVDVAAVRAAIARDDQVEVLRAFGADLRTAAPLEWAQRLLVDDKPIAARALAILLSWCLRRGELPRLPSHAEKCLACWRVLPERERQRANDESVRALGLPSVQRQSARQLAVVDDVAAHLSAAAERLAHDDARPFE